jgi:protein-S-isoprenylcysteine O-methyltransferase Ste14
LSSTYLILSGSCLIGLTIRAIYEVLKKDGHVDPENKPLFIVVFVAMCTMLASWPFMCPRDPWRIMLPDVFTWIGFASIAVALALAFGGLLQLRGLENIDHLVTNGLYSRVRHPMYVGFILWIVGWVVCYGRHAARSSAWRASATSSTGGTWRNQHWNRDTERTVEQRGFE